MDDLVSIEKIQTKIFTLRRTQVMLDEDLAEMYGVETKRLNEQVKRNIVRFPEKFMFQLSSDEMEILRSQFATSSWGGRRTHPFVFTEQGVAMLSAVLKSETAIHISIRIMDAFVSMRRFMLSNAQVFQRLDLLEIKQLETDRKLDQVFTAIETKSVLPKQGIFYNGQVFDAWQFASDLIRSAKTSLVLIDNYVDDTVLALFAKRQKGVAVTILTKNISSQLAQDVVKFNQQFEPIILKKFTDSHDRFLIIDSHDLYHIGASLKDLGKKWFAFSKMDIGVFEILKKVQI